MDDENKFGRIQSQMRTSLDVFSLADRIYGMSTMEY